MICFGEQPDVRVEGNAAAEAAKKSQSSMYFCDHKHAQFPGYTTENTHTHVLYITLSTNNYQSYKGQAF